MPLPSTTLLWLLAALGAFGVAVSIFPDFQAQWGVAAAAVALGALVDLVAALRLATPQIARLLPATLALGVPVDARLRVRNASRAPLTLEVYDHHPQSFECRGLPRRVALAPAQWAELSYEARPVARGEATFAPAELRLFSPLRLWQVARRAGDSTAVRVYPNFQALARYTLLATDNRLSQIGVLQVRRRGEGMEFHQLREYRQGDAQRAVDWKATARSGKLISREYEDEKDQRVLLVVDCGRRMAAKDDAPEGDALPLSHFDHTLNAALLLAHVALRQGDAVGMMTMGGVSRYCEPRKSLGALHALLNRAYDLEPTLAMPDYELAASQLMLRVRRRALVIMLTNLRDEDDATLLPALRLLRARHLVVLASLREAIVSRALSARVDSFERAVTHAAASDYLERRSRVFSRIENAGAITLDVEPARLPIALVNRYLGLKRAGTL
ncbi:MAG TPA: DUF58 domain-containing protein [Burkholderiales bacterium]|nr:DUF58 domain-containing protein [Burkholderiales bacterium]